MSDKSFLRIKQKSTKKVKDIIENLKFKFSCSQCINLHWRQYEKLRKTTMYYVKLQLSILRRFCQVLRSRCGRRRLFSKLNNQQFRFVWQTKEKSSWHWSQLIKVNIFKKVHFRYHNIIGRLWSRFPSWVVQVIKQFDWKANTTTKNGNTKASSKDILHLMHGRKYLPFEKSLTPAHISLSPSVASTNTKAPSNISFSVENILSFSKRTGSKPGNENASDTEGKSYKFKSNSI